MASRAGLTVDIYTGKSGLAVQASASERGGAYVVDSEHTGLVYEFNGKSLTLRTEQFAMNMPIANARSIAMEMLDILDDIQHLRRIDRALPNGIKTKEES